MRLRKTLIVLGIAAAAVGAAAWLGAGLALNFGPVKASLNRAVSDAIKMPLTIRSIWWSPFSGLELKGTQIPAPGQQAAFLDAERLAVRARLLPLLGRRLIIDEVRIERPILDWSQDKEGRFVLPQSTKAAKAEPVAPQPEKAERAKKAEPFVVETRRVGLEGGRMVFRDNKGRVLAELKGVSGSLAPAGGQTFSGSANAAQVVLRDGGVAIENLEVRYAYTPEGLELSRVTGVVAGGRLEGSFKMSPLEAGSPMKAQAKIDEVDISRLLKATGSTDVGLTGKLNGTLWLTEDTSDPDSRRGEANFTIAGGALNQNPVLQAAGLLLGIQELIALELRESRLNLEFDGASVKVEELVFISDKVRLDGNGRVKKDQKLDINARLSMEASLLDKLPGELRGNFVPGGGAEGWSGVDFKVKGTLSKPKSDLEERLVGGSIENAVFDILGLGGGVPEKKEKPKVEAAPVQ